MELKHDIQLSDDELFDSFNRTFMELKHFQVAKSLGALHHVLIGPSWN